MKKRLLGLLLVLVMVVMVLPFTASAAECVHDYSKVVRIYRRATCTRNGNGRFECTLCGARANLTIPAAHTPEEIPAVAPTCTTTGLTAGEKCSVCDQILTKQIVVPATHDFSVVVETVLEPTCTTRGIVRYQCANCKETKKVNVNALGHTSVDMAEVPATCVKAGTTAGKQCSVCQAVLEGMEAIPATGKHSYTVLKFQAKAPTCTESGTATYKCEDCEATRITYPAALGHTPVDVAEVPATCVKAGTTAGKKCSVCEEVLEGIETIAATGKHHFTVFKAHVKVPTCTEKGTDRYQCKDCTATSLKFLAALGHSYVDVAEVPATCVKEGVKAHKQCSVCEATEGYETIPATGKHDYAFEAHVVAPTCTKSGTDRERCKNCTASRLSYPAALGHSYVDVAEVPSTCVKEGVKAHKQCSVCEVTEGYETIPATGKHKYTEFMDYDSKNAKEPTCDEDGKARFRCETCTKWSLQPVQKLGHIDVEEVLREATCTKFGWKEITCSREGCGKCVTQKIEATGHTNEIIPAVPATCTATGLTEGNKCSVCGEILTAQTVTPMAAHEFTIDVDGVDATCTADGYTAHKKCANCDATQGKEEIDTDGHIFENYICKVCGVRDGSCEHENAVIKYTAPKCTDAGSQSFWCPECNYEKIEILPQLDHQKVDKSVAGTCITMGREHVICTLCNQDLVNKETGYGPHNIVNGKCTVCGTIECAHSNTTTHTDPATCTQNGSQSVICDVCGTILSTKTLPATGHSHVNGICSVCGHKDSNRITFDFQDIFMVG